MRKEQDIKAPDGYLLGGVRRVHADGTVLFQRGYWQAPKEWAGMKVWVHEDWYAGEIFLEVAPPGIHIYTARIDRATVRCERTDRADAKPGYRSAVNKAWAARNQTAP